MHHTPIQSVRQLDSTRSIDEENDDKAWDIDCVLFFNEAWTSRKLNSIHFFRDAWFLAQNMALSHDIHSRYLNLIHFPIQISPQTWFSIGFHVAVPEKMVAAIIAATYFMIISPIWGWLNTSIKLPFSITKSSFLMVIYPSIDVGGIGLQIPDYLLPRHPNQRSKPLEQLLTKPKLWSQRPSRETWRLHFWGWNVFHRGT